MSMLPTTDAAAQLRVRAEEALERKGGASRRAGELAGHFSAMLEALNGVDAGASASVAATSGNDAAAAPAVLPRLGVGAVSVFAQSGGDAAGAETPDAPAPDSGDAQAVVDSALGAGNPADFRWLTTLIVQSGAQPG
ncbi:hypothetical protein [Azospirillum sp. SYSU D00513]|uniref:hypothetical protein n=1 Tax=Azospirillum sp. SYSU D00513 TaxID=2812561 RepID=UPI001A967F2C|nr:hypothetical protein [Azospirillum sp. SYSU D00513]